MHTLPSVVKPLAVKISCTYARAMEARAAVEHRLSSISRQEAIALQWQESLSAMAAKFYPGKDMSSYPVQTRIRRELELLERYRQELQERLSLYVTALKDIDQTVSEIIEVAKLTSSSGTVVPWPLLPKVLEEDPWPNHWPSLPNKYEPSQSEEPRYFFNRNRPLPPRRIPSPTSFVLVIADYAIQLQTYYEEGIEFFRAALSSFSRGEASSRWLAIIEAVRCGIHWPQLDLYLAECSQPWLPDFFVDETFGLRGSSVRRDELAYVMAQVSPDAGRWYLSKQPMRYRINDLDHDNLEELIAIGLVRWGPDMPLQELLRELPFSEVKSLFALAGLPPPRGFDAAVERYGELALARGGEYLAQRIHSYVDPSEVIEVREIDGWSREERLGPRARANVLVSSLILLGYGNQGVLQILDWPTSHHLQ